MLHGVGRGLAKPARSQAPPSAPQSSSRSLPLSPRMATGYPEQSNSLSKDGVL
jgi:hypothetical protein